MTFRDDHITEVDNFDDFKNILETKTGFISAHWDGTDETENKIKELTKATIRRNRCIPSKQRQKHKNSGKCILIRKTVVSNKEFSLLKHINQIG